MAFLTNPKFYLWIWRFIFTPLMVGIFFGVGNFGAYWLC
jgi:hypothetical protein